MHPCVRGVQGAFSIASGGTSKLASQSGVAAPAGSAAGALAFARYTHLLPLLSLSPTTSLSEQLIAPIVGASLQPTFCARFRLSWSAAGGEGMEGGRACGTAGGL